MSRIGNKIINVDSGVKISQDGDIILVEGTHGKIELQVPTNLNIEISGSQIKITNKDKNASTNRQGLFRSLLSNAVIGVVKQWTKSLELIGVGYRAQTSGNNLVLNVGFTHSINIPAPTGVTFKVEENKITVIGADKYKVGEVAAYIRRVKPPEPYKGKGIRYQGEHIRKKLGKAAKAVGGAGTAK
jgi:large subunit ribosomal protein L6